MPSGMRRLPSEVRRAYSLYDVCANRYFESERVKLTRPFVVVT
jgi:hypothetical protein